MLVSATEMLKKARKSFILEFQSIQTLAIWLSAIVSGDFLENTFLIILWWRFIQEIIYDILEKFSMFCLNFTQ